MRSMIGNIYTKEEQARVQTCVAVLIAARQQVFDVRSKPRFNADEPEPRQVKRFGHIPGLVSWLSIVARTCCPCRRLQSAARSVVPTRFALLEIEGGAAEAVRGAQNAARQAACRLLRFRFVLQFLSCAGITASSLVFALHLCDFKPNLAVYDGSAAEWLNSDVTETLLEPSKDISVKLTIKT